MRKEILNEFDSEPYRAGPVVTGRQDTDAWIVTQVKSCHLGDRQ